MRSLLIVLVIWFSPVLASADSADEQRATLVEHFGKLKDLQDFSATAVQAALQDEEFKSFFDGYSKVITVVQVADKIADAKDKEAMQILAGEAAKASLDYMAKKVPQLAGAVGAVNFIGWANTGLTLFKDFVFDPWLEKKQMDSYIKKRQALEPEDAITAVGGWGYTRERALKQLEKQGYNMDVLWENGEKGKLSPVWEAKLRQFVTASFETKYTRKLLADAAKQARKQLPTLDKQAKKALAKHKNATGDEGTLTAEVRLIQGAKVEFYINGKLAKQGPKNIILLGKDNKLEIRAVTVGARRQQARDLAKKKPAAITLDGIPTDYAFAYSAGKNASAWVVKDESYDWKVQTKFNKVTSQTKAGSRPNVKNDKVAVVIAGDVANEEVTLDVSGRVQWEMTGTRANGDAAKDSSDESETGAIVVHITPRK